MSYPRNAASPLRIAIGAVVQISDGAVQTSGVSVAVRPEGAAESAGAGLVAYSAASGVVYYTPTQAETNHTAICIIAYKAACIPAQVTLVPSASDVAGLTILDPSVRVKLDATQPDYAPATAANLALANAVLAKIDSGLVVDGLVHRFTANMLELAPAGGDATLVNQTTMLALLNDIADQTDLISGPGEDQVTIEILDDGIGVDDVSVWITSDSGGNSVVAGSSVTNGQGKATFLLTAGTSYYLWASKTGKISIQGQLFVAAAD